MMTRLEFTEFKHVNLLYAPLNRGSIAVHTCDIAFDNTEVTTLLTEFIILYSISKRLVPEDKSEVKIKIPEGTLTAVYTAHEDVSHILHHYLSVFL